LGSWEGGIKEFGSRNAEVGMKVDGRGV
jgi:hypothetical protein